MKNRQFLFTFLAVLLSSWLQESLADMTLGRCIKDVLVILDTSGSIGNATFETKIKPFVRRLAQDPRLDVSSKGSHISILTFNYAVRIELKFENGYNKTIINKTIENLPYLPGMMTITDQALTYANQIFQRQNPLNYRDHVDDVIVLLTDGLPTGRDSIYDSITEAQKLKNKGVVIVEINIGGYHVMDFVAQISTNQQWFQTTSGDLVMIVEPVVEVLCQQPTADSTTTILPETTARILPVSATPTFGVVTTEGKSRRTDKVIVAGGVTGSLLFIVLVVIVFLFLRKRIRNKQRGQSIKEFQSWHERHAESSRSPTSPMLELNTLNRKSESQPEEISYLVLLKDWEISQSHLKLLDKKLGAGQFGIVKEALYISSENSNPEIVAVKMLKDNARESDLSDLLAELEILKKINKEPHPNVIRFIGGCSLEGKLLVVTEFCPGGNLQKFLRKSGVDYVDITSTLNQRELLKMAVDVASGMVHLSAQKFVHRDLAARNILLGEDKVAKVSDFGLARDIGNAEEYVRSNQNLLPVKWMALESLLHGRFTTASDVWSFGILLHEIATLGEEPYKNISPYDIVTHVGSGCRMSKPSYCSSEIYEIMKNCWKVSPGDRPTFSQIWQDLHDMLTDNDKSYINVHQVEGEGLQATIEPCNVIVKDDKINA